MAEHKMKPEDMQDTMPPTGAAPEPEKETLLIPLDPNGNSDTVYLCVNGKNMLVRRGEPVEVPRAFAEVYRNAQTQHLAAVKVQRAAMSKE